MINKFSTITGITVPALTADQMKEIDRIAIEETGPNLFQMMENAGRNLALLTAKTLADDWQRARVLVLAGSGGNGGGGICAARHLANHGLNVSLCLVNSKKLGDVPAFQRQVYQQTAGKVIEAKQLSADSFDFIIDALIGYSLKDKPRDLMATIIQWVNESNKTILSLDVPSGVDATTGNTKGVFIKAKKTLTLALPKTGLYPDKTGELYLGDIGIPISVYKRLNLTYQSPFETNYYIQVKPE